MNAPTGGLLDLEQLRELADLEDTSGEWNLSTLFELFALDASEALERMRELAHNGDSQALVRMAHRLKGSSVSIGATGFSRHCREIELGAGQADRDLDLQIEHARCQLDATLGALRQYLRP